MAEFVTAINCIDGRVQGPVSDFLRNRFKADHVDMITCPGPAVILSQGDENPLVRHLRDSVMISLAKHGSALVAVAAHHDCAASGMPESVQRAQICDSVRQIRRWRVPARIIGLWVNRDWSVKEIRCETAENGEEIDFYTGPVRRSPGPKKNDTLKPGNPAW